MEFRACTANAPRAASVLVVKDIPMGHIDEAAASLPHPISGLTQLGELFNLANGSVD